MSRNINKYVEILDTTLRDGEQTPNVSFAPAEKLAIAKMLLGSLKVDRVEIGSARVSEGEQTGVKALIAYAKSVSLEGRMEILGFVDHGLSVNWIKEAGGKVINLLTKGSEKHCVIQLKKTPEEHFAEVEAEILYAVAQGLKVNVYLEDWSNGMLDSLSYVEAFVQKLRKMPIERIMLPDTLGVLSPARTREFLLQMFELAPECRFDFHGHNDYGLVSANSLEAVLAGVDGIHTTVNGLGERTGNQALSQLCVVINDMTSRLTRVKESELYHATNMVQNISGKRCAWNAPIIGADVFTQTCGVHADGDKKGGLYVNKLLPERFGRRRNYALGKLSGKASLDKNLEDIGVDLAPEVRKKVLQEIIRLGDKKKTVSVSDLPFLIADALSTPLQSRVKVINYHIVSTSNVAPSAEVTIELDGQNISGNSSGDGGYDAFVKALRKILKSKNISMPVLSDYEVRIPPGGKTDALVETTITWESSNGRSFSSTGVDCDQMVAAIIATEKMLNLLMAKQS